MVRYHQPLIQPDEKEKLSRLLSGSAYERLPPPDNHVTVPPARLITSSLRERF
jgi:hypothetical protein